METLFENSYTKTKELVKELYRYYYFQSPLLVAIDIIIGLSFLINIALFIKGYTFNIVAFVAPLFIALQFYKYFRAIKVTAEREAELSLENVKQVNCIVTDEVLKTTTSLGAVYEVPLTKIKQVTQTKNLILVRSQAKMVYILPKDTFTKGTSQEFIDFLRQKDIKIFKAL